jgi:hypothetical protein
MVSSPARAEGEGFIYTWSIFNLTGGTVTGIGSSVAAANSEQPSLGWIIPAYVFGGLNILTGMIFVGVAADLSSTDSHKNLLFGLGFAQIAVSAIDFIAASIAVSRRRSRRTQHQAPPPYPYQRYPQPSGQPQQQPQPQHQPEPPPSPQLSFSPLLLADAEGKMGYGVGLQVVGW